MSKFWITVVLVSMCLELPAQDGLLGVSLPADFRPFSDDSPYNTPIESEPRLEQFSAQMIQQLKESGPLKGDFSSWTVPLFVIDESKAPKKTVRTKDEPFHPSVDPEAMGFVTGLPIPDGVWPDPEKDGHMVLVDPKTRKAWDFSRLESLAGRWQATRVDIWDLNDRGYRRAFQGERWWMAGARGSGMPLIAGLIRPEQIAAGEIPHALVFACKNVRRSTEPGMERQLCNPVASRSDGRVDGFAYLPMGVRVQLDPTLDLNRLGLSKPTKVIAQALQKYGMFLCDGSESFKLYFQNLGPEADTWNQLGDFSDLEKIPTDRFRVLACSYRLELKSGK